MKDPTGGDGTVQALLDRLNNWRLPRALALKDRVDKGEKLTDNDMQFLQGVFEDSSQVKPLLATHPEMQALANKLLAHSLQGATARKGQASQAAKAR